MLSGLSLPFAFGIYVRYARCFLSALLSVFLHQVLLVDTVHQPLHRWKMLCPVPYSLCFLFHRLTASRADAVSTPGTITCCPLRSTRQTRAIVCTLLSATLRTVSTSALHTYEAVSLHAFALRLSCSSATLKPNLAASAPRLSTGCSLRFTGRGLSPHYITCTEPAHPLAPIISQLPSKK